MLLYLVKCSIPLLDRVFSTLVLSWCPSSAWYSSYQSRSTPNQSDRTNMEEYDVSSLSLNTDDWVVLWSTHQCPMLWEVPSFIRSLFEWIEQNEGRNNAIERGKNATRESRYRPWRNVQADGEMPVTLPHQRKMCVHKHREHHWWKRKNEQREWTLNETKEIDSSYEKKRRTFERQRKIRRRRNRESM